MNLEVKANFKSRAIIQNLDAQYLKDYRLFYTTFLKIQIYLKNQKNPSLRSLNPKN